VLSDGLNRYAYVRNNPLLRTDPTGHRSVEVRWENGRPYIDVDHGKNQYEPNGAIRKGKVPFDRLVKDSNSRDRRRLRDAAQDVESWGSSAQERDRIARENAAGHGATKFSAQSDPANASNSPVAPQGASERDMLQAAWQQVKQQVKGWIKDTVAVAPLPPRTDGMPVVTGDDGRVMIYFPNGAPGMQYVPAGGRLSGFPAATPGFEPAAPLEFPIGFEPILVP
jgi:hypothetical protein